MALHVGMYLVGVSIFASACLGACLDANDTACAGTVSDEAPAAAIQRPLVNVDGENLI
jgi:hypothetical protein